MAKMILDYASMPRRKRFIWWHCALYAIAVFWPVWLLIISNDLTLSEKAPPLKKIAIVILELLVPILLWKTRAWIGRIMAVLFFLVSYPPVVLLIIYK